MSADYQPYHTISHSGILRDLDNPISDSSQCVVDDVSSMINSDAAQEGEISASSTAAPSMGSRASWESSQAKRAKRYADIAIDEGDDRCPSQSSPLRDPNTASSPFRYAVEAIQRKTSFQLEDEIHDCQLHAVDSVNEGVGTRLLKGAQDQAKRSKLAIIERDLIHNNQTSPQIYPSESQRSNVMVNATNQSADEDIERSMPTSGEQAQTPAKSQIPMTTQDENIVEFLGELECHSSDVNPRSGSLHFSIAEPHPCESMHIVNRKVNTMLLSRASSRDECCIETLQLGLHNCGCYPSSLSTDFIQHRDDDQCCTQTQQLGYHTCGYHSAAVGDFEVNRPIASAATGSSKGEDSRSNLESDTSAYQRFIARLETEKGKENAAMVGRKKLCELRDEVSTAREERRARIGRVG